MPTVPDMKMPPYRYQEPDYAALYRRIHPRQFPFSPYEPQRELRNLWPAEQQKFRRMVDAVTERCDD